MKTWRKLSALVAAGAIVFVLAGTASAVINWATPFDHYASQPSDGSNEGAFWEAEYDLDEDACHKLTSDEFNAVNNGDGTADLGAAYGYVIVKQANPNAKDVEFDNTIFKDVAADETVFADTNGNGVYDDGDSQGISHIIVCDEVEETAPPSFEESQEAETEEPSQPVESEPVESEPVESQPVESQPVESQPVESQPVESQPVESFEQSFEAETDVPTEPPTSTIGGGTSGPADGAWLLVVALGVFLASVVVLTPARAKNR